VYVSGDADRTPAAQSHVMRLVSPKVSPRDFAFAAGHRLTGISLSDASNGAESRLLCLPPKRNERLLAKALCKANVVRRVATDAGTHRY
jgi:hypothetical protein